MDALLLYRDTPTPNFCVRSLWQEAGCQLPTAELGGCLEADFSWVQAVQKAWRADGDLRMGAPRSSAVSKPPVTLKGVGAERCRLLLMCPCLCLSWLPWQAPSAGGSPRGWT